MSEVYWKALAEKLETRLREAEAEHPTGVCLERTLKAERDKLRRELDAKDHQLAELKDEIAKSWTPRTDFAAFNAVKALRDLRAYVEALPRGHILPTSMYDAASAALRRISEMPCNTAGVGCDRCGPCIARAALAAAPADLTDGDSGR